jgi:hypothetical protein
MPMFQSRPKEGVTAFFQSGITFDQEKMRMAITTLRSPRLNI